MWGRMGKKRRVEIRKYRVEIKTLFLAKQSKLISVFFPWEWDGEYVSVHLYKYVIIICAVKQSTIISTTYKDQIRPNGNKTSLFLCKDFSSKKIKKFLLTIKLFL